MSIRALLMIAALLVPCSFASAADRTKDEAVKMVEKAAAFLAANGKDKFLAEANLKKNRFTDGELYVFVTDLTYTMVAHPVNPALVGQYIADVPDVDGKMYRKEIVEIARTKGRGWVDYKYKNPVSGKIEAKTTYLYKAGDMIILCGIYKS